MRNRVQHCALVRTKLMRPIAALAMVCTLSANALADDGGRWMFRFETRFGGDRNEHLLQFATGPGTLLVPHDAYPIGAPFAWTLYSSDPKRWAVLNVSGAGERTKPTTGLAAALGLVLMLAPLVQAVDEAGDRAAEEYAKNNPVVIEPLTPEQKEILDKYSRTGVD